MADIAFGIDAQNAGLFSAAAYTPIGETVDMNKLGGWRDVTFQVIFTSSKRGQSHLTF